MVLECVSRWLVSAYTYMYIVVHCMYIHTYITHLFYYSSNSEDKETPSVSNQLAELSEHREVDKLTTTFDMPKNEPSTSSFIDDEYEKETPIPGYAMIDIKDVRQNQLSFV